MVAGRGDDGEEGVLAIRFALRSSLSLALWRAGLISCPVPGIQMDNLRFSPTNGAAFVDYFDVRRAIVHGYRTTGTAESALGNLGLMDSLVGFWARLRGYRFRGCEKENPTAINAPATRCPVTLTICRRASVPRTQKKDTAAGGLIPEIAVAMDQGRPSCRSCLRVCRSQSSRFDRHASENHKKRHQN